VRLLRATRSSGIPRCGPVWIVVATTCGPKENLAPVTAGRCGFRSHAFAGHVGLERRGDARNSEVRVANSDSELKTPIQSSEKRGDEMFREETGHEIDCQGVVRATGNLGPRPVWAISGVGHHLARAALAFGLLPVRATLGFVPPLVRAIPGFGFPPLRADNLLWHQEVQAMYLFGEEGCGPSGRRATPWCRPVSHWMPCCAGHRVIECRSLRAADSLNILLCRPSWRFGFWLAGCEPVWWCRVRADGTFGRYSCGPQGSLASAMRLIGR